MLLTAYILLGFPFGTFQTMTVSDLVSLNTHLY